MNREITSDVECVGAPGAKRVWSARTHEVTLPKRIKTGSMASEREAWPNACAILLLTATAAEAGDCLVHPVTLIEFEILSCASLDEVNARNVFQSLDLVRPWPSANDARAKSFLDQQIATVVAEHAAI